MNISTKKALNKYLGINTENESTLFVEREDELNKIRKNLGIKQFLNLFGEEGSGKSALASQYAYKSYLDNQVVVCWLTASLNATFKFNLIKLINELGEKSLDNWSRSHYNSRDQIQSLDNLEIERLINYLGEKINNVFKYMKFLFILDDLKNEKIISHFYLKFEKNVKFIITSRNVIKQLKENSLEIKKLEKENISQKIDEINELINSGSRRSLTSCIPDSDRSNKEALKKKKDIYENILKKLFC